MSQERKPNRLIKETSPYLLKHAYNPVDWYPWGDEAVHKAKNDNKPVFLSIGYSSCHWCHRMRDESFEDEATAALLNKNFIPVKVDREERPELDNIYMTAVQSMSGQGGWPLSVFLTPDLKPFFGGTYFPPEQRDGMPSFKQVLEYVAQAWKEKRSEIVGSADQIMAALTESYRRTSRAQVPAAMLEAGYATLVSSFDAEHGGYGSAPKFPMPLYMGFLLRYYYRTKKELALRTVVKTLEEIAKGGIRDHLGGGFHRYSTDAIWLVPHFEKMLYDNALLAGTFLEAFQLTRDSAMLAPAVDTLSYMLRELRSPEGAFYSAQDADTTQGEGVYYSWTPGEISQVLGAQDGEVFAYLYGVTRNGNYEGSRSILHVARSAEEAALRFSTPQDGLAASIGGWKSSLLEARLRRPTPATDNKVLTSWNGLAISAMVKAGRVLGDAKYVKAASEAADFVLRRAVREGRLQRMATAVEADLPGTLEDYSFFIQGLIDLFEASGEPRWLEEAMKLNQQAIDLLWDKEGGAFFMTGDAVPARIKVGYDGPTPSGNSAAAINMFRLAELTGNEELKAKATEILEVFHEDIENQPSGHTNLLIALDLAVNGMKEVVITSPESRTAAPLIRELDNHFLPNAVLVSATTKNYDALAKLTTLLEGRLPGSPAKVYICENNACRRPLSSAEELKIVLDSPRS